MNKERRTRIAAAMDKLEEIAAELGELAQEEQEAFDSLPEGLQNGEKGQRMEEIAEELDWARDDVVSVVSDLGELIDR